VEDHLNGAQQLCMHGGRRKAGQGTQGLETGHDVSTGVGMQRAASALMAGIERGGHLANLSATKFTHNEADGQHPQRLTNEGGDPDLDPTLDVGRTRLQPNNVRVRDGSSRRSSMVTSRSRTSTSPSMAAKVSSCRCLCPH